ncbi:unnamed protein product [Staurois parvus]|uniref:Uncharacterized protein n=1 Tax=Staurois parvus TaxID=386267 RepID=A0ABN9E882_9NEOB|nr:unnamed protein product [Staurois parvus]
MSGGGIVPHRCDTNDGALFPLTPMILNFADPCSSLGSLAPSLSHVGGIVPHHWCH